MKLKCEVWDSRGYHTCIIEADIPRSLHALRELAAQAFKACDVSPDDFALLTNYKEE